MTIRARVCDYCTIRMAKDEREYLHFYDGEAEFVVCSPACEKKMRACITSPKTMNPVPGRWSSHKYTMRSSLIVGRGKK